MNLRTRAIAATEGHDDFEHERRPVKRVRTQEDEGGPSLAPAQRRSSPALRDPESGSVYSAINDHHDHHDLSEGGVAATATSASGNVAAPLKVDPSLPPDTPPGLGRPLKPEERARRQKLMDDSMVEVVNPRLVRCRWCQADIKLSMKSLYDPQHWTRHKGRCIKKHAKERELWPIRTELPSTPKSRATSSATPPLTPDEGDEGQSSDAAIKEESPPPAVTKSPAGPRIMLPSFTCPAFDDYVKNTGRTLTWDLSSRLLQPWNTWQWGDVQPPVWDVKGSELEENVGLENIFSVLELGEEGFVPLLVPAESTSTPETASD